MKAWVRVLLLKRLNKEREILVAVVVGVGNVEDRAMSRGMGGLPSCFNLENGIPFCEQKGGRVHAIAMRTRLLYFSTAAG